MEAFRGFVLVVVHDNLGTLKIVTGSGIEVSFDTDRDALKFGEVNLGLEDEVLGLVRQDELLVSSQYFLHVLRLNFGPIFLQPVQSVRVGFQTRVHISASPALHGSGASDIVVHRCSLWHAWVGVKVS